MKVPVNKIIPFSSVDGPGNRTAVFLQGCNFDCKYCHNPETRAICIACGECVENCPVKALVRKEGKIQFDSKKCCGCDTCIKTCKYGASPRICEMDAEEVMAQIREQIPFIRGVTVSGGECTLYPEFLEQLFWLCKKEGLGTLIDSNGTLDFRLYPSLLAATDGVMLDIKAWSEKEHIFVTGVSNKLVLENAKYLAKLGKLYEVRTVIVPGLFDYESTVEQTAKCLLPFLDKFEIRYKLITYRAMGVREEYASYESPSFTELEKLEKKLKYLGFQNVIII